MHVHIDLDRGRVEEEEEPRTRALGHGGAVAAIRRRDDAGIAKGTSVYEQVGPPEPGPRTVGTLDRAAQAQLALLRRDRDQPRLVRVLPDRADPRTEPPPHRQIQELASTRLEDEAHIEIGQRERVHHIGDRPRLGRHAVQKARAHRCVQEQVAHDHGRPAAASHVLVPLHAPGQHPDPRPHLLPLGGRLHDQARHGGDRRERLAPEPQRVDLAQILGPANLARRVPIHAHDRVLAHHAPAVVGNPDAPLAAPLDRHAHRPRTRVDGVLDQLLHDRGRALHHLARRDLVGHMVGQDPDPRARHTDPPQASGPSPASPKKRSVFDQVSAATPASVSPRIRASASATWTTSAGSLRRPRFGTGARYGESVSIM